MAEGSDDLGTGARRGDERADREGVNELAVDTRPDPGQPGLMQRHMNRGGRIWAYRSSDEGTV